MIANLIKANLPLIFVETEEPKRILNFLPDINDTNKEMFAVWKKNIGISYKLAGKYNTITSTKTVEAALEYLSKTNKEYLLIFVNTEPEYEMLYEGLEKHTLVFVNKSFKDYAGAMRVSLPFPDKAEYLDAFQQVIKPKQNKKLLELCSEYAVGMTVCDAVNCFKYSYSTNTEFINNKHLFTKSNFLDIVVTKNTFEDLGGFSDFKKWFNERKFWYTKDAKEYGFPRQKGIVLYGTSGNGKSLCASCLGNEAKLPLIKFNITKVYDQYVGRSEENIRNALLAVEKISPCVLWIEELGRLFPGNDIQSNIAHQQVLAIILEWLQEHNKDIFLVATANGVKNIPLELVRPGRFTAAYRVNIFDKKDRREILNIHFKKNGIELKDIDVLINRTENLTGAEIENKIQDAIVKCYNEKRPKEDILQILKDLLWKEE